MSTKATKPTKPASSTSSTRASRATGVTAGKPEKASGAANTAAQSEIPSEVIFDILHAALKEVGRIGKVGTSVLSIKGSDYIVISIRLPKGLDPKGFTKEK